MGKPRKHHYVPQFHLARFTHDGTKDGQLYVLDLASGKQWPASPGDAACERDFYMLDSEGDVADSLEACLRDIEGRAAPIIAQMIQSGALPSGEDYQHLIDFLGVMALRVPGFLNTLDDFHAQVVKMLMLQMTATEERWQGILEEHNNKGLEPADVSWERMREFVRSGEYTITVGQNYRMSMIPKGLTALLPLLTRRNWVVVRTAADAPGLICSDCPLLLCWNGPTNRGPFPPAFGLSGTNVSIALDQRSALIGVFEDVCSCTMAGKQVGAYNMWVGLHAERFVYSTKQEFTVTMPDGSDGNKAQFVEYWQKVKGPRK